MANTSSSSSSSSESFCLVKSSINIDETFSVPHIVLAGETISSTGLSSRPGGKGANVSAAIGLAGGSVRLSAAVGADATWPVDELRKRHVDTEAIEVLEGTPTGRAFIQIAEDGENSIVLLKGANYASTQASDPAAVFASAPRKVTHVVVHNEIPFATSVAFLRHARTTGAMTIYNPSPMPSASELRALPWHAVDVLILNAGEGAQLLAALNPSPPPAHADLLPLLADHPALSHIPWLILTQGANGVQANVHNHPFHVPPVKPSSVRDTTGAGDTFAGNLVAALMGHNVDPASPTFPKDAVTWAAKAASVACETDGAMQSIPSAQHVRTRHP